MDILKKDLTGTKCNSCGYERRAGDLRRRHRCPKCNQPYILTRFMTPNGEYRPNEIPLEVRFYHTLSAILLFIYGSHGVWVNDLVFRMKGGFRIHLHDFPAWLMFGSLLAACVVLISVVIDHYDRRNNEAKYKACARYGEYVGWSLCGLSLISAILMR